MAHTTYLQNQFGEQPRPAGYLAVRTHWQISFHLSLQTAKAMRVKYFLVMALLCSALPAGAQLSVTVSPPKVAGQRAVVPVLIKNGFAEKVESARAAVFLLDQDGKMVAQGTRWVIGGGRDKTGLAPGATNTFHFVVTTEKPITTTNLTANASFNPVLLEGGKCVDVHKDVEIESAAR